MNVQQLLTEIHDFYLALRGHKELYLGSLLKSLPTYPIKNQDSLDEQSESLSRTMGRLRPYLLRFQPDWHLSNPQTGMPWDALHEAVSVRAVAIVKGESMRFALDKLNQVIGRLESLDREMEVPEDLSQPISRKAALLPSIYGYIPLLHPAVVKHSVRLFTNGHYSNAIESSVKAVFEHLRTVSGASGDGADLANKVFSEKNPVLRFSELKDDNERNEQIGFMEMLKAFHKGVRHPRSHSIASDNNPQLAFEYMVAASLLCRRVDEAAAYTLAQSRS